MVHLSDFGQAGKPAASSGGENCTFFLYPNSLPWPYWGSGVASRTSGPVAMMFAPEFVDRTLASVSELVMLQSFSFHGVGVLPFTLIQHVCPPSISTSATAPCLTVQGDFVWTTMLPSDTRIGEGRGGGWGWRLRCEQPRQPDRRIAVQTDRLRLAYSRRARVFE